MKTLHLIRHAKSSWDFPELADIDRPLNKRGKKACVKMAEPIVAAGCDFKTIFCSPALRAQQTINRISKALDDSLLWQTEQHLYTFSFDELLKFCVELDDELDEVVLVGHNPGFTDMCNFLIEDYIENLPTCGYGQFACDIDSWAQLNENCAQLVEFITPKGLKPYKGLS